MSSTISKTPAQHTAQALAQRYRGQQWRHLAVLVLFVLITCAVFLASLLVGGSEGGWSSWEEIQQAFQVGTTEHVVLMNLRLPRATIAVLAGIGLSLAGATMQSVLRNPLASSSTIGTSQGAAFGAAIAIVVAGGSTDSTLGSYSGNPIVTAFAALVGALGVTAVIVAIALNRKATPSVIILAGVALSSLASSGTSMIQYFADELEIAAIVFWQFGDLGRARWNHILIIGIVVAISAVYFMWQSWAYNCLDAGEEVARALGISVLRLRVVTLVVGAIATAVVVSVVGVIAFVGLIAPHITRRLLGEDYRYVLPGSAVCGALVLLLADTLARTIIAPVVLPVGAVTSFLGAPLFLYIIIRQLRRRA